MLNTNFFTYFEYAEINGGIYFAHKHFKRTFISGRCFSFTLATTLVTLLELISEVIFGPIFSS